MPVSALVTTSGSATANAYVSVAVADQFDLDRPAAGGNVWVTATPDQKSAAILWATKLMDAMWDWNGYPTDAIQNLLWPRGAMLKRNGWEYVDIHVVPIEIQQATAEYARQLLVSDRTADSDIETQGLKQLTAGPVSLTFKDSVFAKVIPDAVVNLIPPHWGAPRALHTGYRSAQRA